MISVAEAIAPLVSRARGAPPVDILEIASQRYTMAIARWLDQEERRWSFFRREREFIGLMNAGQDLQAAIDFGRDLAAETFNGDME
jgi:hypothetical protein